jgi:hypothetical protein
MINADKPATWKQDIADSVDFYNAWFLKFAPVTYREQRVAVIQQVQEALRRSRDLRDISPDVIRNHPAILPTFRMCCCPPLARERPAGLAGARKTLVEKLEEGALPPRTAETSLTASLSHIVRIIAALLDKDLFPWLAGQSSPSKSERYRASTIVADRLCGSMSDPIIRNAQEKRQLDAIGRFLAGKGYVLKPHPAAKPLTEMEAGTYSLRTNVLVGDVNRVKIPIDVVIQPRVPRPDQLPVLIEAKSAGDFTNVNKRRKEESKKMSQLKARFGPDVRFILFLCGYFNAGYLGYEAADGMDWIWEHRIADLDQLGL